jgi:hypothetical protein
VSDITQISKATQWKPGHSGNLNGRPVGSRTAFSQGYISDFAKVWQEEGLRCVQQIARKNPTAFVGIASKLIPAQVQATIETQLPGNLSLEDWSLLREIMDAIKQALPDAANRPAGEVLELVKAKLLSD